MSVKMPLKVSAVIADSCKSLNMLLSSAEISSLFKQI